MSRFGKRTELYEPLNSSTLQTLKKTLKENLKKNPKEIPKKLEDETEYKNKMKAIVDSLPVTDKESIKTIIDEYGTDFPLYAQCQSSDSEDENPWVTALLSLSVIVLDTM